MKFIVPFALLLFVCMGVTAQDTIPWVTPRNSFFVEIGGRTLWYSINYDYIIPLKNKHHLSIGAGGSITPISGDESSKIFAASMGYIYGYRHSFEFGTRYGYWLQEDAALFSLTVGYRYQNKKGFLFRAGVSPIIVSVDNNKIWRNRHNIPVIWPYLSFGYSF